VARDFPAGLSMQVEDSLGVVVELLTRLGEQHPTALPLEQRRAERSFEGLHTLADGRLSQADALAAPVKLLNSAAFEKVSRYGSCRSSGLATSTAVDPGNTTQAKVILPQPVPGRLVERHESGACRQLRKHT
jgi:hypothetical protein